MSALVKTDIEKARVELERMKSSLRGWLKYRLINDAVMSGAAPTKKPRGLAQAIIVGQRSSGAEQQLAKQLHVLLSESFPNVALPSPDLGANPNAAVELARIAIDGPPGNQMVPTPQGFLPLLLTWPVLVVGGVLLAVTTAIKSSADLVEQRERYACIQAGACTDYGFWLKAGGVAAIGYVAYQAGLFDKLKGLLK